MGPWPMCFFLISTAVFQDHRFVAKNVLEAYSMLTTMVHALREKHAFDPFALKFHARASGEKVYKNDDNIGTVLFEKSDCGKHCWSSEEFAILNSRRMFQDILPRVNVINSQNDQYIALLMDYFHICLECVRKLSIGKTKHLMLKALADTMGGYLKVYILPLTKHSYYAGNIKYRNAKRLFELFEELKNFLHTNGDGWRVPSRVTANRVKIPPIIITPSKSTSVCNGLVTYPAGGEENHSRHYRQYHFKKKRLVHHQRRARGRSPREYNDGHDSGPVTVPLPFLDDEAEPNSIALPFKKDNLQSLQSEKSAFAIVKYYVASVKCIESKSRTKIQLEKFNRDLHEWIGKSVTPHLEDDKWYPAFGGVLRVMASLKESGYASTDRNKGKSGGGEYQVMPQLITETIAKQTADSGVSPLYKNDGDGYDSLSFGTTELIVIALASALLVWLFVGLTVVCYRFLTKNSEECEPCESTKSPPVAVLYEAGDYCTEDVCPSKASHEGIVEKFKKWWRSRFGGCPGGCDRYEDEERCLAAMSYTSKDTVEASNSGKSIQKRQYNKSVSVSRSTSPRERRSFRKVCYSSDESFTNSDSPTKSRMGTSTGDE